MIGNILFIIGVILFLLSLVPVPGNRHRGSSEVNYLFLVTHLQGRSFLLRNTLRRAGIDGLTIGTVHALPGAERPVILFSATYGKNDQARSCFFDAGPNMLNVAVSRAKETFILFSAPEIFQRGGMSPSMQLYRHISKFDKSKVDNPS